MTSYGFTHATFISNVLNATTNYNGNFIPYVPKNTLAVQVKKTIEIKKSNLLNRIVLNTIYKGTGGIYWNDKNSHKQDYYNLLDARISFIRRNMQVDFWGTNLTNTVITSYSIHYTKLYDFPIVWFTYSRYQFRETHKDTFFNKFFTYFIPICHFFKI